MNTIKNFESFINESRTYQDEIDDIRPDDSVIVKFPENFELEYTFSFDKNTNVKKFICDFLDVWYVVDDDFRTIKYFFHEKGKKSSTCQEHHLTPESSEKVLNYLKNTPIQ